MLQGTYHTGLAAVIVRLHGTCTMGVDYVSYGGLTASNTALIYVPFPSRMPVYSSSKQCILNTRYLLFIVFPYTTWYRRSKADENDLTDTRHEGCAVKKSPPAVSCE